MVSVDAASVDERRQPLLGGDLFVGRQQPSSAGRWWRGGPGRASRPHAPGMLQCDAPPRGQCQGAGRPASPPPSSTARARLPSSPTPWLLASPAATLRAPSSPSQPMSSPPPAAYYSAMLRDRASTKAHRASTMALTADARQQVDEFNAHGPYRCTIFVTMAVFSGYAALVLFQQQLGLAMGLEESTEFRHACSLNYVGNLIFRLAHNFVFCCIRPRLRVYISLISIAFSSGVLAFVVLVNGSRWIGWVYICYFVGGVGVGTFESNLLSSITPLGHSTKVWAIVGMPIGFNIISIGGFALLAPPMEIPLVALYAYVFASCCFAMVIFHFAIPDVNLAGNGMSYDHFIASIRAWREWIGLIKSCAVALAFDMFCVSFFTIIMLYILNDKQWVPILGNLDGEEAIMDHDYYFAIFGVCAFVGDSTSRMFAYWIKPRSPTCFLLLSAAGALLCLCQVPVLALLGIFAVCFANGAIYGTSTRHIDTHVPRRHNLVALSFWLFVGDFGGVAGSNAWSIALSPYCEFVRRHGATHHYCVLRTVQ